MNQTQSAASSRLLRCSERTVCIALVLLLWVCVGMGQAAGEAVGAQAPPEGAILKPEGVEVAVPIALQASPSALALNDEERGAIASYLAIALGPVAAGKVGLSGPIQKTPEGAYVVVIRRDWLALHWLVPNGAVKEGIQKGSSEVPESIAVFLSMPVCSRHELQETLAGLGVSLESVYRPATAPFFTNGKGLVWFPEESRYVLVVRGVEDTAANRCWKAAISVSTCALEIRSSVPCIIR